MENPVIGYMYKYEDIFARFNFSYASGKVIHDTATGKLYKLNVAYTANTVASDAAFTTWLNNTTNATPTYSTGGTVDYNAGTAYSANDTIKDPATGDIYKCIAAAPAGTPLSNTTNFQKITQGNQSYNASTDTPAVVSIPNGTELFVETAGTQTIGGVSYDLNKGDLIKKSNAGTYSIIRSDSGNTHIEKSANYTLTVVDLPESEIVVLHNTNTTSSIDFTLPAGFTTDVIPSYVDSTGTIITLNAGESLAVRNMLGNNIEIIGDGYGNSGATIVPIPATTAEALAGADNSKFITPATLDDVLTDVSSQATVAKFGTTRYSTDAGALAKSATDKVITASNLAALTATAADMSAGTDDVKFTTSKQVKAAITAAAGSGSAKFQYFTSNGTFTVPAGVTTVYITAMGGGGGGSSGLNTTGGVTSVGSGGGSGDFICKQPVSVSQGSLINVVIGLGGIGGVGDPGTSTSSIHGGSGGQATIFGSYISCGGGGGAPTNSRSAGSAGGSGGSRGSSGGKDSGGLCLGGKGGGAFGGAGGGTGFNNGENACMNMGGGGGGGNNLGSGGNGASGFLLIEW